MASVNITSYGYTPGTSNSFYIVWKLNIKTDSKKHLDHFTVKWKYRYSASGPWFDGGETNVNKSYTTATYTIPDNNVYQINAWVNAYSTKHSVKKGKKTVQQAYWTCKSDSGTYTIRNIDVPGTIGNIEPLINSASLQLSTAVSNDEIASGTNQVRFQVLRCVDGSNQQVLQYDSMSNIVNNAAISNPTSLAPEYYYIYRGALYNSTSKKQGPWSDWSGRLYGLPGTPSITGLETNSPTSTRITFSVNGIASSYTVEYQNVNRDFSTVSDIQSQEMSESDTTTRTKIKTLYLSDLTQGTIYYFRVRASNSTGDSQWSDVKALIVGTEPAAPTTWSDITSAELGQTVYLYWTHNSQDGSSMRKAQIQIAVNGTNLPVITVDNEYIDTRDENKVQEYALALTSDNPMHAFSDADVVTWEIRTKGVYEGGSDNGYGDWSTTRTIYVYQKPVVTIIARSGWLWNPFNFQDDPETGELEDRTDDPELVVTAMTYPVQFQIESTPITQTPVSYHLTITADEDYTGTDEYGNEIEIAKGTEVYSGFFDSSSHSLSVELTPNDVVLENGVSYTATVLLYMNSGLSDDDSVSFITMIEPDIVYPEIVDVIIDEDDWSASIYPICYANDEEDDNTLAENTTLEIYRIDSTGNYIFVDSTDNKGSSAIIDPHPALDYARYRVVAKNNYTGRIAFQDYFYWPVGCTSIIIQWDESWNAFEYMTLDDGEGVTSIEESENVVKGAQLVLPYNIDVSESYAPDAALIEYIGRNYPVSYYGTQRGQSAIWNVEIPYDDEETLFALRELADWMGDVYVREPSGTGYWANISVSMSQKHKEVLIPVSLSIKRVEGGA